MDRRNSWALLADGFFQTFCFVGGGNCCFYPKWPKQDFQVMTEKPPIEVALFRFQNLPRLMLIAQQLLTHANSLDPTQKKGHFLGELTVSSRFVPKKVGNSNIFPPQKKKRLNLEVRQIHPNSWFGAPWNSLLQVFSGFHEARICRTKPVTRVPQGGDEQEKRKEKEKRPGRAQPTDQIYFCIGNFRSPTNNITYIGIWYMYCMV